MREINCRAWDRVLKVMLHDVPVWGKFVVDFNNESDLGCCESAWDLNGDVNIMQSIGLNDKNGTEIYEGDLLKYVDRTDGYFSMRKVEYKEGKFVLVGIRENDTWDLSIVWQPDTYFIVGNIYENPELLELGAINPVGGAIANGS